MYDHEDESFEEEQGPSKSQLKRESLALQELGGELMGLSDEQLKRLHLPAELMGAVLLGQDITARGGLRRQKKFIGKLLREIDADPIREAVAALKHSDAGAVRLQHACEAWRDRMLAEGEEIVDLFLAEHPEADRTRLRQWVRDGRREREAGLPPRAARQMFRYLREILAPPDDTGKEEA